MKDQLPISTKYLILIFGSFVLIAFVAIAVLTKNYFKFKTNTSILIRQEINGTIQSMKEEGRGSYFLEIQTKTEALVIHSLPIAWEVKNYNIQVGDSISKEPNSRVMKFYKLKNGVLEKYCEFKM